MAASSLHAVLDAQPAPAPGASAGSPSPQDPAASTPHGSQEPSEALTATPATGESTDMRAGTRAQPQDGDVQQSHEQPADSGQHEPELHAHEQAAEPDAGTDAAATVFPTTAPAHRLARATAPGVTALVAFSALDATSGTARDGNAPPVKRCAACAQRALAATAPARTTAPAAAPPARRALSRPLAYVAYQVESLNEKHSRTEMASRARDAHNTRRTITPAAGYTPQPGAFPQFGAGPTHPQPAPTPTPGKSYAHAARAP